MADEHDGEALLRQFNGLEVDFGDQGASGVNHEQFSGGGFFTHSRGDTVGAENDARSFGHFGQLFDENGTRAAQLFHDVAVVDDFLPDVDGRAIKIEGNFDYIDGSYHARTEAAGFEEQDLLFSTTGRGAGRRFDVKKGISGRHRKKA